MATLSSLPSEDVIKDRAHSAKEHCWDVEALYPSWEAWEGEMKRWGKEDLAPHWSELEPFRKTWQESPAALKKLLELYFSIERGLSKLYAYAHLRHDEDVASEIPKQAHARATSLICDFRQETAWIEPALLALSEEKMQTLIKAPELKEYAFHLEKVLRLKAHTMPTPEEELIARAGKALGTASHAFGAFNNADLKFPPVQDSQGKERELTHGKYLSYLRDPDRKLREEAFKKLHRSFLTFENTLAELLNGQVQSHLFEMKARKYASCLEAALFPNQIDVDVYKALIKAVKSHLPAVQKYVALRKKALGVDVLHLYDMNVPLVKEVKMNMSYDEAVDVIFNAVSVLGKDYQQVLIKGLKQDRWVDRDETERKRSGAYSSGCYDSMPYILMNYHGTFNDVMTLAHEAGHSMHSFLSCKNQPYHFSQYTIFVAEVASTFHEELVLNYLRGRVKTKEERIFLLSQKIDDMRATLVRQTMFAEFELLIHQFAEEGTPLTPALLKQEYRRLNQEYFGPEMFLDEEIDIEWARIPHFYYNFYVYQYATGISAAHALVEKVLQGGNAARERYLAFLSSGSRQYPLDLLYRAGVDMRSSEPVESAMDYFNSLVIELEKELFSDKL